MSTNFPVTVGSTTLDRVPGGFSCVLNPPAPLSVPFSAAIANVVYRQSSPFDPNVKRLAGYVQVVAPADQSSIIEVLSVALPFANLSLAIPLTASAPSLLDAVCATLLAYAVMKGHSIPETSDDVAVILYCRSALELAKSVPGSGVVDGSKTQIGFAGLLL